jgi:hypothetical protein
MRIKNGKLNFLTQHCFETSFVCHSQFLSSWERVKENNSQQQKESSLLFNLAALVSAKFRFRFRTEQDFSSHCVCRCRVVLPLAAPVLVWQTLMVLRAALFFVLCVRAMAEQS